MMSLEMLVGHFMRSMFTVKKFNKLFDFPLIDFNTYLPCCQAHIPMSVV